MTTIINISVSIFMVLTFHSCSQTSSNLDHKNLNSKEQTDACDNPDADISCCFLNIPPNISNVMSIADTKEPGDRLFISGTIFKADGKTPYPDILLYAYHTDNSGHYSKRGDETGVQKWHGHLHGWCKTSSDGKYEIQSIRPARYPDNTMPAHIHAAIKTSTEQVFYITDFVFNDDSLVNSTYISSLGNIGGTGIVNLTKSEENIWKGSRDIILEK